MITLTKDNTEYIYLTLTENQLMTTPNYLFIFTNRSNNETISFVLLNAKDISLYKERYNKFLIDVTKYFANKLKGQYIYNIYEQTSVSNLLPTGLNLLESGIMMLKETTSVYTEYITTDTFKVKK